MTNKSITFRWRPVVIITIGLLLLAASLYRLETIPPLWWDEGWNLTLARNWVEQGYYGQILDGERESKGLAAAFPVIAPAALSFKLLGVGVWQARLPGVIFTWGALALMFWIVSRVYDRRIAGGTMFILLLTTVTTQGHPILLGRQFLGEMPSIFFLLCGIAFLWLALRRWFGFSLIAALFFGIAIRTKGQVLPFWLASLCFPLTLALIRRNWRVASVVTTTLAASFFFAWTVTALQNLIVGSAVNDSETVSGLYLVTGFVLNWGMRRAAFIDLLWMGLPALVGLAYMVLTLLHAWRRVDLDCDRTIIQFSLLGLAGSWMIWFLLLAMNWARYLAPIVFLSAPFAAFWLSETTDHYNLSATVKNASDFLLLRRQDRRSVGAVLAIVILAMSIPLSVLSLWFAYTTPAGESVYRVEAFIEDTIPRQALIESYDSELFFLLPDHRFHCPPDEVHVVLNQRTFLGQSVRVDYDPLAADPDYLVVGPFSDLWGLYDPVIESGAFRLIASETVYQIYARVR